MTPADYIAGLAASPNEVDRDAAEVGRKLDTILSTSNFTAVIISLPILIGHLLAAVRDLQSLCARHGGKVPQGSVPLLKGLLVQSEWLVNDLKLLLDQAPSNKMTKEEIDQMWAETEDDKNAS